MGAWSFQIKPFISSGFASQTEFRTNGSQGSADSLYWKDFVCRIIHLYIPGGLNYALSEDRIGLVITC